MRVAHDLKADVKEFVSSKYFFMTFLLIFLKSLLFIVIISYEGGNEGNLLEGLYYYPQFLLYFSFICIFLSFGFIFSRKGQAICFYVLNFLFTFLVLSDIWLYRSNGSFISPYLIELAGNVPMLGPAITSMMKLEDVFFVVDLIVILIKITRDRKIEAKRNIRIFVMLILGSGLYLFWTYIKAGICDNDLSKNFIFPKSLKTEQAIGYLNPIGYHIIGLYIYVKETKPYVLSTEENESISSWLKNKEEKLPDNQYYNSMKGKNIIIIQWESLENFVIGKTVNGQEITPNLNRILKNSYYFDNFYEQTWNAPTSDAELITNTSSLPTREGGAAFNFGENLYKYSFPNIFKNLGYNTLAAHADKASFWNWKDALQSVGYDKIIDESELNIDEKINLGLSDKSYLNQLTDILKKEDSPFLAYSVTLTSHTPFILPESDKSLKLTYNLENTKMGGYLQCINYTDKYIGEVLRKLDEKGILKNTLVVIYGDHEGIHKYYRNEVKRINGIESWMKNNDKKVPLILYNQSIKGEVKHVIGGQVDILPTVTYLFGVNLEKEWDKTIGRNLFNTKKNFSVLPSGEFIGTESYPGEKEQMLKSIEICDKLIRANYYKD